MPTVDRQFVQEQRQKIRSTIDSSSPALVYSGALGILIIAANKSISRDRIGQIMDRSAIVPRGDMSACDSVFEMTCAAGHTKANETSWGDVSGRDLEKVASEVLGQRYHNVLAQPLAVEACIVQLNETPEDDYLTYVGPDGNTFVFDRIRYMGPPPGVDLSRANAVEREEQLEKFNVQLRDAWQDIESQEDGKALTGLEHHPGLEPLFHAGARREIVLLDRRALARRAYEDIYRQLQL